MTAIEASVMTQSLHAVQLQQLPLGHRDEKDSNGNYESSVGSEYGQKL